MSFVLADVAVMVAESPRREGEEDGRLELCAQRHRDIVNGIVEVVPGVDNVLRKTPPIAVGLQSREVGEVVHERLVEHLAGQRSEAKVAECLRPSSWLMK